MSHPPEHELFEAKVEVAFNAVETLSDALNERQESRWSVVEDIILGRAWLVGIFESFDEAQDAWGFLKEAGVLSTGTIDPVIRALPENEWRDSYKAHFHAWRFGRLHWVPVWERATFRLPQGDTVLWLDPGLAFGTGNHETTRLCIERIVEYAAVDLPTKELIDAGCGSGILALSAAKLGFGKVLGFDNDPEAIRVSRENAVANELEAGVDFQVGDLKSGLAGKQGDVVVANILADVLINHAELLVKAVRPGGILILSGILAAERNAVVDRFVSLVPTWTCDFRRMGEWTDVVLVHG
jgi:ribosomal protein L11 methyltransferase